MSPPPPPDSPVSSGVPAPQRSEPAHRGDPDSDFPTCSAPARRLGAGPSLCLLLSVPRSPVTSTSRLPHARDSFQDLHPGRHGTVASGLTRRFHCWYLSSPKVGKPREKMFPAWAELGTVLTAKPCLTQRPRPSPGFLARLSTQLPSCPLPRRSGLGLLQTGHLHLSELLRRPPQLPRHQQS